MKRSSKAMMLVVAFICMLGCGKIDELPQSITTTESSSDNITVTEQMESTTNNIGENITDTVAKRGYAAVEYRTYADEDMKRLGVDKKLVVICDWRAATIPEKITSKVNELLVNKYGCDFVVEFVGFHTASGPAYDYGDILEDIRKQDEQADIVVTMTAAKYSELVKDGFLEELTEMLTETDAGKQIYATRSENRWEQVKTDGKIYGIPRLTRSSGQHVLVCNKQFADDFKLNVEEKFSFYDMDDMLEGISDELTEQGLIGCYAHVTSFIRMLNYYDIGKIYDNWCGHGVYAKKDEKGEWVAFNPLLDDEFIKLCKTIIEYKEKGWLVTNGVVSKEEELKVDKGKFLFCLDVLTFDGDMISGSKANMMKTGTIDVIVGGIYNEYLEFGETNVTGIASWSKYKDEAFKLLEIMQTKEDICELLIWGVEDEDYVYVDKEIIVRNSNIYKNAMGVTHAAMLNPFLSRPMYLESDNISEFYEGIMSRSEKSPFLEYGISHEEYFEIADGYDDLRRINEEYCFGLLNGIYEDVDATVEEALKLQREAGIDELVDKVNKMFESRAETND